MGTCFRARHQSCINPGFTLMVDAVLVLGTEGMEYGIVPAPLWHANLDGLLSDAQTTWQKKQNKPVMEALVAASVLVAAADGTISPNEQKKFVKLMQRIEHSSLFETNDVVESFQKFVDHLALYPATGTADLIVMVDSMADKPEIARTVIRLCISIAQA